MVQRLTSASTVLRRVLDNPALQDCQENNGFGDMMDEDVISNISVRLNACVLHDLSTLTLTEGFTILSPFQADPSDPQRFPFILVGNKIDSDGGSKRMVPEKKAREWCASKGDIPYFETSAKEDHNVDTAFLCIASLALEHEHDQDIYFKTVAEQVPDTEQTSRCVC
ncbi:Ras-related protein Rab7 [Zea mays]|uniref:Ras-related protein Rab7 n=1 Tax=Zea mays TaxID=4577 RepID=A0A3L6GAF4_MAIZE|nr:Ras-related protein Rab7 [Zea mays]